MAADRARRFMTSLQTMSDEALTLVQEDVRDLVKQRINGIVHSVERVHRALDGTTSTDGVELQQRIEDYTRTPLRALPR